MIRPKFLLAALIALTIALPGRSHAQTPPAQPDPSEVGNVASVQGSATVTRNGTSSGLKLKDPIFKGDLLKTGANAALGITFDDETTFNLSANASITVNEFVYEEGGSKNSALFNISRGTVAFAANQVAKTGDMKIATPSTTLGIRGTSGVVDVPEGATPGLTGEVAVKLYQDEDGRVGRIELLGQGGARLGLLTRAASGFTLRAGGGGRFAAVPLTISPQQIARDRGLVQRTFAARNVGRQMVNQRRSLRGPNQQRNLRGPNQQRNQNLRQPGGRQPGQPRQGTLPSGRQGAQTPGRQGAQPSGRQSTQPNNPTVQGQPGRNNTPGLRQQNLQRQPVTPNTRQKAAPRKPPNERERRGR